MKGPLLQASVPSAGTPKSYATPEPPSSTDSASRYDMSLIPDSRVFFYPRRPFVAPTSSAETILKTKGIYSHDPILDHNLEELWRFLASHVKSPHMAVRIVGTHTESSVSTNEAGIPDSQTVTDFSIQLDLSRYVNRLWSRIFTRPFRKDAATPTVMETLEEYAASKNAFKEFRLIKVVECGVEWDLEKLTKSLKEIVLSSGYQSTVTITFPPMQDYKVVALASNGVSKAAHSKVVRVLCVVSCLFLDFWPAWAIARKRMKNRLVCEYGMAASGEVFHARNYLRISKMVELRLKKEFVTAL